MKNTRRAIIIGLAVAGAIAVVLVSLLRENSSNKANDLIVVHEINTNDVIQINVASEDSTLALIIIDGVWYTEDGRKPADQVAVNNALTQLSYLYASDNTPFCGTMPLESYGLDPPRLLIDLLLDDGSTARILFGDFADDNSYCYFMKYGDDSIYLISITNYKTIEVGLVMLADL